MGRDTGSLRTRASCHLILINLPLGIDGHHIIHWADGGPTELENLVNH